MLRASLALAAACLMIAAFTPVASAAVATVGLGTATSFAVLAGAGITNTGSTTITGDVGTHPTGSETGFGPGADSVTLTGVNHGNDAVTMGAKADLVTAYNDAAGRPGGTPVGALGAGQTLVPGVYADNNAPDSMSVGGILILDGLNDPSSVFIFQSGSTLGFSSSADVQLSNGAQACNVFWQVTSSATLATGSHVVGTIMALDSISLATAATLDGRALARNGAVTMDTNTIHVSLCQSSSTSSSSSGSSTSTSSTSSSSGTSTSTSDTSTSGTISSTATTSSSLSTGPGSTSSAQTSTNGTSTGPVGIPFFPTTVAVGAAIVAGIGGAVLILRRRLR